METKILVIGTIKKGDSVLMRKKFAGSPPYTETWYSFGADFISGEDPKAIFTRYIHDFLGIEITASDPSFWDTEVKADLDGVVKQFVYLDLICHYVSGEPRVPEGLEAVEWISPDQLTEIDIVPPSVVMFKRLGILPRSN